MCNRYILYPEILKTITDTAIGGESYSGLHLSSFLLLFNRRDIYSASVRDLRAKPCRAGHIRRSTTSGNRHQNCEWLVYAMTLAVLTYRVSGLLQMVTLSSFRQVTSYRQLVDKPLYKRSYLSGLVGCILTGRS